MKKLISYFLLLLLVLSITDLKAQNEKFKALFMYNFTKYIEWPGDKQSGDFVIGILGNSPMKKELEVIATKKKVGSQPIKVKVFNSINDIGSCHILFIPSGKSSSLDEVKARVGGKGVLIITDRTGFGRKGSGINYVLKGGHQDFEINKSTMAEQRLKVNSALYSLGTVIN
ncbi:YfiR family protein [Salinivirga cyanobacteriivorans]